MTVDIHFGKYVLHNDDGDQWESGEWPGYTVEDDGTQAEFSIYAGEPLRSFPNAGFSAWTERDPIAFTLAAVCWRDERQVTHLDDGIMRLIEALPDKGMPIDRDRARWFKYWARRARETFGAEAVIYFY